MQNTLTHSIVFITGTFISHTCWTDWITYFEREGYKCISPAWPYKDATPQELRNRPAVDPLSLNTIQSLTDYFAEIIRSLPEQPILIGHSLGGLIVQLLLQRKLGAAGVAVHTFPPSGVNRIRFSFLKAIWETMMLFTTGRQTYLISFRKWKYVIANGLSYDQQKELYYSYAIPESKKIIRDLFRCNANIDFRKSHAPLLFTSGSNDKLVPSSLNYSNYQKYTADNSITDFWRFNGHIHLIFGQPLWKKEADFILHWLRGLN